MRIGLNIVRPLHRTAAIGSEQPLRQESPLSYLFGIGGVLLFQIGVSYAIILAGTGNGSFVGLSAMLLAVLGVPSTALVNFLVIRSGRNNPASGYVVRLILISLALPAAQLALLVLVSIFRL
jgi:hypothetical protein